VKFRIDREICVRRVQRTQMNVTTALAPPKEQDKKTQMNVTTALVHATPTDDAAHFGRRQPTAVYGGIA
jgi:alkaline phosphatase